LAVAEAEAGGVTETAADWAESETLGETEAGRIAAAEEEAGIVDTTATAVAAVEADKNDKDEDE
jgi:hypothetical protein